MALYFQFSYQIKTLERVPIILWNRRLNIDCSLQCDPSLFAVVIYYINKFTGCFYVNSPRSIECEENVKEPKKKKRQSTILGGQKREKKENCERCSFFYFPKSCNSNWTASETTTMVCNTKLLTWKSLDKQ